MLRFFFKNCGIIFTAPLKFYLLILFFLFCLQEQYELVHKAIAQLFEKQLEVLESPTNAQIHDGMVRPAQRAQRLAL